MKDRLRKTIIKEIVLNGNKVTQFALMENYALFYYETEIGIESKEIYFEDVHETEANVFVQPQYFKKVGKGSFKLIKGLKLEIKPFYERG